MPKKLLARLGYPNGFELTLSSTNDRYVNDSQISQAVAQYFTRVGIKTNVDAMTASIYFPKRAKRGSTCPWAAGLQKRVKRRPLFQLWVATTDSPKGLGTQQLRRLHQP